MFDKCSTTSFPRLIPDPQLILPLPPPFNLLEIRSFQLSDQATESFFFFFFLLFPFCFLHLAFCISHFAFCILHFAFCISMVYWLHSWFDLNSFTILLPFSHTHTLSSFVFFFAFCVPLSSTDLLTTINKQTSNFPV